MDDGDLLERFARTGSEEAFAGLVNRYLNLVHSVAMRHTNNPHHAEEITQSVFVILARKARSLTGRTTLAGWLHHTARLVAANFRRSEQRRVQREQEAFMQSTLENDTPTEAIWHEMSPLLDEAMGRLRPKDRDALVLRYFEGRTFDEVGQTLGIEQRAAQKRVARGVERLRGYFARRGVALTSTIIVGIISTNATQAAPAGLAATVASSALQGGSAAAFGLVQATLWQMTLGKLKTAVAAGLAGALIVTVLPTAAKKTLPTLKSDQHEDIFTRVDPFHLENAPEAFVLQPSPNRGYNRSEASLGDGDKFVGRYMGLPCLFGHAYGVPFDAVQLPSGIRNDRYDLLMTQPCLTKDALREELRKQLGLTGRIETRRQNISRLVVARPDAPNLKPSTNKFSYLAFKEDRVARLGRLVATNQPVSRVALVLSDNHVVDRTGLTGNYDFVLEWKLHRNSRTNDLEIKRAMLEQLGLQLLPSSESVEILVLEPTNS